MRPTLPTLAVLLGVLAFTVVATSSAWLSDDAWITLRTLDMARLGHGLVYNPGERVLAATHPLWLLLLGALTTLTGEHAFTTLALSLVLGSATVALVLWRLRHRGASAVLLVAGLLAGCKGLVDFTTSGLEGPLSHGLLALICLEALGRARPLPLAWLMGALVLTRMDHAILVAPLALLTLRGGGLRAATGALPLGIWLVGSWVYYGRALPNTAAAKLATGVPRGELAAQGLAYLGNSLAWDPVLLLTVGLSLLLGARAALQEGHAGPVAALHLGVLLYLAYVVAIGGDFMSGRFLAAPFLLSALLLAWRAPWPILAGLVILGLLGPRSPWRAGAGYDHRDLDEHAIADERGFYFQTQGLRAWLRPGRGPLQPGRGGAVEVQPMETIGLNGYAAGPAVHVVDLYGLADPVLARLPCACESGWRPGHWPRALPEGYLQALETGELDHVEAAHRPLVAEAWLRTRAPLWDPDRWRLMLTPWRG